MTYLPERHFISNNCFWKKQYPIIFIPLKVILNKYKFYLIPEGFIKVYQPRKSSYKHCSLPDTFCRIKCEFEFPMTEVTGFIKRLVLSDPYPNWHFHNASIPFAKSIRNYFSYNVCSTIYICIYQQTFLRSVQTSFYSFT